MEVLPEESRHGGEGKDRIDILGLKQSTSHACRGPALTAVLLVVAPKVCWSEDPFAHKIWMEDLCGDGRWGRQRK